jgi:hypothetical protein
LRLIRKETLFLKNRWNILQTRRQEIRMEGYK